MSNDWWRQYDAEVCQYDGCTSPAEYYEYGKRLCLSHHNEEYLRRRR